MNVGLELDFKKWEKELLEAGEKIETSSKQGLKKAATHLYTQIIRYTPVGDPSLWQYKAPKGYSPGTLKKSWKINFGPKDITITNDQPYAQRVENGWSTQAPTGMMRKALLEFPAIVKQALTGIKF